MRKVIFIFVAFILIMVCIEWVDACPEVKTDKEMFKRNLTYADMYEYKDSTYDYVIRYPSFFSEQPNDAGHTRFCYNDPWATVVLEGYTLRDQGKSIRETKNSLAQLLHATSEEMGDDYFILSGPQYEQEGRRQRQNESLIEGYSFYSKFIRNGKLWFVYTMVYPDKYHDVLTRLFKEIDEWQIWKRPRLKIKQAVDQTPKAVPEEPK